MKKGCWPVDVNACNPTDCYCIKIYQKYRLQFIAIIEIKGLLEFLGFCIFSSKISFPKGV